MQVWTKWFQGCVGVLGCLLAGVGWADTITYDFNDGMQGWYNRVWDVAAEKWVDLKTGVTTIPADINNGLVYPWEGGAQNGLFSSTIQPPIPGDLQRGNYLITGYLDAGANVKWVRSPEFYLDDWGKISFSVIWGQSLSTETPVRVVDVPAAAAPEGWSGVFLRDVDMGTFVAFVPGSKEPGGYEGRTISVASVGLSDPLHTHRYTLDVIVARSGLGGWIAVDDVTIPGRRVADLITSCEFPGLGTADNIGSFTIQVPVPMDADLRHVVPMIGLAPGATCVPAPETERDFSTPQQYTVTGEDGRVLLYTVVARRTLSYDFSDGMQGWHNRVMVRGTDPDGYRTARWRDLPPNVATMPAELNGGTICNAHVNNGNGAQEDAPSTRGDNCLFSSVMLNIGGGSYPHAPCLCQSNLDTTRNLKWARSPAFFLTPGNPISFSLVYGYCADGFPTPRSEWDVGNVRSVVEAQYLGWAGLALRDEATGQYVLTQRGTSTWNGYRNFAFSAEQLSALDPTHAYTLDLLETCVEGGGWIGLDDVVLAGERTDAYFTAFSFGELGSVAIGEEMELFVPYGTDVTALAPVYELGAGAVCDVESGTRRDFTTPQTYTVTTAYGATRTFRVKVSACGLLNYDFNNNSMQGWRNRVWDNSVQAWVDLAPDLAMMPSSINGGVIHPSGQVCSLFRSATDNYPSDLGHGSYLTIGQNLLDSSMNTKWARSPEFYLTPGRPLTFNMIWGCGMAAPTCEADISPVGANIEEDGWSGVALYDVDLGRFVLTRNGWTHHQEATPCAFGAAELAGLDLTHRYTLDLISGIGGASGWISLDDVSIPGVRVDAFLTALAVDGASVDVSSNIEIAQPTGTNVKRMTLTYELADGATAVPKSGSVLDFTKPQTVTVTTAGGVERSFRIAVVPYRDRLAVRDGLVFRLRADAGLTVLPDGQVCSWRDVVGNQLLTPVVGTERPLRMEGATPGGQAAVDFQTGALMLAGTGNLPVGANPRTVFMYARSGYVDDSVRHEPAGFAYGTANDGRVFGLVVANNANTLGIQGWGQEKDFMATATTRDQGEWYSQSAALSGDGEGQTLLHWRNGEQIDSRVNVGYDTGNGVVALGTRVNLQRDYQNLRVAEVLVYDRVLSDAERAEVEKYLLVQWGGKVDDWTLILIR